MAQIKSRIDYLPPSHFITTVDLVIELAADITIVRSKLHLQENSKVNSSHVLRLNGEKHELQEVKLNGAVLPDTKYLLDIDTLTLKDLPAEFDLEIYTHIKPQENTDLMGLYKSGDMFCTQCEPEGFRKITYFLDRPDILSSFTTTIIAPQKAFPVLLSNGNLIAKGVGDKGKHWVKWHDPFKKPCYLFAVVAGDLGYLEDYFITMSNRKITLRIYAVKKRSGEMPFCNEFD